jgi:acetoin utilization protein AcuC
LKSAFIYSQDLGRFDFGYDHPYKPERAIKAYDLCNRYGVLSYPWMQVIQPTPVDPQALQTFHDVDYLHLLKEASMGRFSLEMLAHGLGTEDNPILPGIYEWSLMTVGATCLGAERIGTGLIDIAFNPLGGFHHARRSRAEGFCYVNDVVIASLLLLDRGLKVAFVDIDAHHCNGVQEAFYDDARILTISFHESGETLYPGTGQETEIGGGKGRGFTVNVPLEAGTDDDIFLEAFKEVVPPLVSAFQPDILIAELGADSQISDPLTHLRLTNNSYQEAVGILKSLCQRILALGGGGYDIYRTARCWTLAWSVLNGVEPEDEFAGVVGGMMFGPEYEVGSLRDQAHPTVGPIKDNAQTRARARVAWIKKEIFPLHAIP